MSENPFDDPIEVKAEPPKPAPAKKKAPVKRDERVIGDLSTEELFDALTERMETEAGAAHIALAKTEFEALVDKTDEETARKRIGSLVVAAIRARFNVARQHG